MVPATYRIPCNAQSHANDHRARYRRRAGRPRRPIGTERTEQRAHEPADTPQPPSAAAPAQQTRQAQQQQSGPDPQDRSTHQQAAAARWQRITDLNTRLTASLDGEGRALWLALEEALHVHWLDVAVDHYQRGYAAGRAQAWLDLTLADRASPHEKLRALSAALMDLVDRLQRSTPGTDG